MRRKGEEEKQAGGDTRLIKKDEEPGEGRAEKEGGYKIRKKGG